MSDWKKELRQIAEDVTDCIRTDEIPSLTEPEALTEREV